MSLNEQQTSDPTPGPSDQEVGDDEACRDRLEDEVEEDIPHRRDVPGLHAPDALREERVSSKVVYVVELRMPPTMKPASKQGTSTP